MIIHYNCTIGSFLLHSFLLIYHPYPPSFHEMIFTLVKHAVADLGGFLWLPRKPPFVLGRACALEHFGVWRIGAREDDPLGAEYGNGWQREANIFYARYIREKIGER